MKKLAFTALYIILLFLSTSSAEAEDSVDARFNNANQAAIKGDHAKAINLYTDIANSAGVSPSLLYNLANSYAKTGRTGEAVANYERALHLAPGDEDILANLAQVRKDAGLYRDDSPKYERLANLLGADQWLAISGASFLLLAFTLLAANTLLARSTAPLKWISLAFLLISLTTLPLACFRYQCWNDAVVTSEDAKLLISPFSGAASTGKIKQGRLIIIRKYHGEFVLVKDKTGKNGWLQQGNVVPIATLKTDNPISAVTTPSD